MPPCGLLAKATFLLALVFFSITGAVAAPNCACKFVKAHSEASVGACAVREDMSGDCDLLWSTPPGGQQPVSPGPIYEKGVFEQLGRSAATILKTPMTYPPKSQIYRFTNADYWTIFSHQIEMRSGLKNADLYNHSLSFLSNRGAVADLPDLTEQALIFLATTDLDKSAKDDSTRQSVIGVLLGNLERLGTFARREPADKGVSEPKQFSGPVSVGAPGPDGKAVTVQLEGAVLFGCFEYSVLKLRLAELIKTDWAAASGGRCQ